MNLTACGGSSQNDTTPPSLPEEQNNKPTVSIVGDSEVFEQKQLILTGNASDTDGNIQSYQWHFNDNESLQVEGSDKREVTIQSNDLSKDQSVEFTLTVTDDDGAKSSATHTVLFKDTPAPSIAIQGDKQYVEQSQFVLTIKTSLDTSEIADIAWQHDSDLDITLTELERLNLQVSLPDIQNATLVNFNVSITDIHGKVVSATHAIEVTALENEQPQVLIDGAQQAVEKTAFSLTANATDTDGTIKSYNWTHNSQLQLTLEGNTDATLSVISPDIQSQHEIKFTVTVADNQGASSSAMHSIVLEPIKDSLTLVGKVTDAPIANAAVELNVGDETFTTTADAEGAYMLSFEIDESLSQELINLRALGTGEQAHVELVSQLGSMEQLKHAAGDDLSLNSTEYFDVNITNVTTAEDALISRMNSSITSDNQLLEARQSIEPAEVLTLSSLLKAVIDYGVELPSNTETTLQLAQNKDTSNALIELLQTESPELLTQIEEEIKADETLVNPVALSPLGDYYLVEARYLDGIGFKLSFNDDHTGTLVADERIPFEWHQDGTEITVSLAHEFWAYSSSSSRFVDFQAKEFTLSTFDSGEHYHAVTATFKNTLAAEGGPNQISTTAKLFKAKTHQLSKHSELLGTWILNYRDKYKNQEYITITLNDNNEAMMDSIGVESHWDITDNVLHISNERYNLDIELVRDIDVGMQVVVNSGLAELTEVAHAVMIKTQDITFADIDYQRTWQLIKNKHSNNRFIIDENDNYHFRWTKNIEGELKDGILNRYRYRSDYREVSWCDVTLPYCEISWTDSYKLLAIHGDKIAVEQRHQIGDSQSSFTNQRQIHIFELSDKSWALGQFGTSFLERDELAIRHRAETNLYAQSESGVAVLNSRQQCSFVSSYVLKCKSIITLNDQRFYAELEGDLIKLTAVLSDEISYLQVMEETHEQLTVCHFTEGQGCTASNQYNFKYAKPILDIDFNTLGQGEVEASTEVVRYGEVFSVTMTANDGHIIGKVSGCEGTFSEYEPTFARYTIKDPKANCTINTEFYSEEPISGDFLLIEESAHEIPLSTYFSIDSATSGTLYGLDEIKPFRLYRTADKSYSAQLNSFETVVVKLDENNLTEVRGFDLSIEEDGTYISWVVYEQANYKNLEKRKVINSSDLATLDVDESSLVGRWYLTYGYNNKWSLESSFNIETGLPHWPFVPMTQQTVILEINADTTGRLITDLDSESESITELSWSLNAHGKLHLTTLNDSDFAEISLFEARSGGYAFAIDKLSMVEYGRYNNDWLRHGSGLIFKAQPATSFENVVGQYRAPKLLGNWGFEIFEDGTVVSKQNLSKRIASLTGDMLSIAYVNNVEVDKSDPYCNFESQECELKEGTKYQVLGVHGDRVYVNLIWDSLNETRFLVYEFSPEPALTGFAPHQLHGLYLHDQFNGTPRQWRFDIDEQTGTATLWITEKDGVKTYPIELVNGIIVTKGLYEQFVLNILSSDSEGITACWRARFSVCETENIINFSYIPPKINVTLNITPGIGYSHNFSLGYVLFGSHAGMTVAAGYNTSAKLSSFDGCGLTIFRESPGSTGLKTSMLFEDCVLNVNIEMD
ncbi:carboxypeptidase-like regulatory domain-containing protein [Pseudoalteromonas luteoviolacea]|nr:carboxypeptidase-like regulatory domain-containing protein [Pseudoalteromonas luteoviolacea]